MGSQPSRGLLPPDSGHDAELNLQARSRPSHHRPTYQPPALPFAPRSLARDLSPPSAGTSTKSADGAPVSSASFASTLPASFAPYALDLGCLAANSLWAFLIRNRKLGVYHFR